MFPSIYFTNKMSRPGYNRSQTKKSVSPTKQLPGAAKQGSTPSTPTTNPLYFCHYRNAVYMGGVRHFKKEGPGILLHDNGVSLLCNHSNDILHGHCLFFAQHCLLSAQYFRGKITQAVYRTDGFLGHLIFNQDEQLEGKCQLLQFNSKAITYATFRKGVLLEKNEEQDYNLLNRVFDLGEIDILIGKTHAQAIKYEIQKEGLIEAKKSGNKFTVGFEKGGLYNGLAFSVIFRGSHGGYNPETHRHEDEFQLRVVERGYMQNNQLNGFGQKLFKNGNVYIGEFRNGAFEGNGLLRNTTKGNWVSGRFVDGNLADLFDYNPDAGEKSHLKILEAMHERKANWIDNEISIVSLSTFDQLIEKVISDVPSAAVRSLEERKQEVLRRIQENFLSEQDSSVPNFLKHAQQDLQLCNSNNKQRTSDTVRHFVQSFVPLSPQSANQTSKVSEMSPAQENKTDSKPSLPPMSKFTPNRKVGQDIRKSKIFDKSLSTTDRANRTPQDGLSRSRSRTPDQKKKIFGPSPRKRSRQDPNETSGPQNDTSLREDQGKKGHEFAESSMGLPASEDDASNSSRDNQKHARNKKSSSRRSKIFNYMQQPQQEAAPKFIYNRMDSLPDTERRRRIGIDEHV